MMYNLHLGILLITRNTVFSIWLSISLQQWVPHAFMTGTRRWCSLLYFNSSSESHSAFVLRVWRNTLECFSATYFYHFLSHLVWLLPWALSAWRAFALKSIPSSSDVLYASQRTELRRNPHRTIEMPWSQPWKCRAFSVAEGKVEVPSAKCLESGGNNACPSWVSTSTPTCSPSAHLLVLVLI